MFCLTPRATLVGCLTMSLLLPLPAVAQSRAVQGASPAVTAKASVLTYHNDNYRTGWNSNERTLGATTVNPSTFGLLRTVALDGRVDAQPLVVPNVSIGTQGVHDVVYVATEQNTLYAIDAVSGAILLSHNFGKSILYTDKDYDDNVYPVYGILSTPVIDLARNAIYVVTETNEGTSAPDVYRLHKISLNTLADGSPPVAIVPISPLANGSKYVFPAAHERQRPGLLEVNSVIYVAFGSTGDTQPALSRGVVAAFSAHDLTPLSNRLTDSTVQNRPHPYYLSSIWQSGYGLAADPQGYVYFSTGNSDSSTPGYNPAAYNFPDSVLKVSADLSRIADSFTQYDYYAQDQGDGDLGSGGTMVVPDQTGGIRPHLLVAGGKDGRAYILNRDAMGGFAPGGPNRDVAELSNGQCWCGPAYFVGADGVSRIVTGGANGVTTWKLNDTPTSFSIAPESAVLTRRTNGLPDFAGTIPAISSNGTVARSAIVWLVQRPMSSSNLTLTLRAFDAANLNTQLFAAPAGSWTNFNSNANAVPTVANGYVYVGANKQLSIFGLLGH